MSISPTFFVLALLAQLGAIKLQSVLLPDRLYFSFSAFLFDNRDLDSPLALAARLAVPFCVAFAAYWALTRLHRAREMATGDPGPFARLDTEQANATLAASGFAAAFLLAWPYILLWDLLIDPAFHRFQLLYLLAYMAYFVGFAFFALAGVNTARAVLSAEREPITLDHLSSHPLLKPIFDAASGAFATALATFLATRVAA